MKFKTDVSFMLMMLMLMLMMLTCWERVVMSTGLIFLRADNFSSLSLTMMRITKIAVMIMTMLLMTTLLMTTLLRAMMIIDHKDDGCDSHLKKDVLECDTLALGRVKKQNKLHWTQMTQDLDRANGGEGEPSLLLNSDDKGVLDIAVLRKLLR